MTIRFPALRRRTRPDDLANAQTGTPLASDAALLGAWRACGLHEGIDLCAARGRHCYYPVGRGEIAFLPGGAFRLTLINGAGTFRREGRWRMDGGLLTLRIGEDAGGFRARVTGGVLSLAPDRAGLRCPERRLHRPEFVRA